MFIYQNVNRNTCTFFQKDVFLYNKLYSTFYMYQLQSTLILCIFWFVNIHVSAPQVRMGKIHCIQTIGSQLNFNALNTKNKPVIFAFAPHSINAPQLLPRLLPPPRTLQRPLGVVRTTLENYVIDLGLQVPWEFRLKYVLQLSRSSPPHTETSFDLLQLSLLIKV